MVGYLFQIVDGIDYPVDCVSKSLNKCQSVCVCVREREGGRERGREESRERDRNRE